MARIEAFEATEYFYQCRCGRLFKGYKAVFVVLTAFITFCSFPNIVLADVFTDTQRECKKNCIGPCCDERCDYRACVVQIMTTKRYGFDMIDPGASGTAIAVCKPHEQRIKQCSEEYARSKELEAELKKKREPEQTSEDIPVLAPPPEKKQTGEDIPILTASPEGCIAMGKACADECNRICEQAKGEYCKKYNYSGCALDVFCWCNVCKIYDSKWCPNYPGFLGCAEGVKGTYRGCIEGCQAKREARQDVSTCWHDCNKIFEDGIVQCKQAPCKQFCQEQGFNKGEWARYTNEYGWDSCYCSN